MECFPFLFANLSDLTTLVYETRFLDSSHYKAPDITALFSYNCYLYKGIDLPYPIDFQAFFVQQTHRLKEKGVNFKVSNILLITHAPSTH